MDIVARVRHKVRVDDICNVIIAGATCSGKTTFATNLRKHCSEQLSVSDIKQDAYFKDLHDVPRTRKGYLLDSPNAFHTSEFQKDVWQLLHEGATVIPTYDVATNKRVAKNTQVTRAQVNIFEGLHTISLLEGLSDSITIYLTTPLESCLERRVRRDIELCGVTEERIRENFGDCIDPMVHAYIAPQMGRAQIKTEGMDFHATA